MSSSPRSADPRNCGLRGSARHLRLFHPLRKTYRGSNAQEVAMLPTPLVMYRIGELHCVELHNEFAAMQQARQCEAPASLLAWLREVWG